MEKERGKKWGREELASVKLDLELCFRCRLHSLHNDRVQSLYCHCTLFFPLHCKHQLFLFNSWETCREKLWNLAVACFGFSTTSSITQEKLPWWPQTFQSRAEQPGAWCIWTSSLSWTNTKEQRVCAVWCLKSTLLMWPCWETCFSGLQHWFFFPFEIWESICPAAFELSRSSAFLSTFQGSIITSLPYLNVRDFWCYCM